MKKKRLRAWLILGVLFIALIIPEVVSSYVNIENETNKSKNMTIKKVLGVQKLGPQWTMDNPFLFGAHHNDKYPVGNTHQGADISWTGRNKGSDFSGKDGFSFYHGDEVPGFPAHPHRGFETVTIVLNGMVDHFDSKGAAGRYGNGDVQWLTTGKGCQHSEMFPLVNQDKPNTTELFQLWLNLPAKSKFAEPDYKMFWSEDIPVITETDQAGRKTILKLIAGSWKNTISLQPNPDSWASNPDNKVRIILLKMEAGATLTLPQVSSTLNRNLYFYEGGGLIQIDDIKIGTSNRVKLNGNAEIVVENGDKESQLALLEGEPINEPVAQYGPFVMNTENEIRQAFADYQQTQFGGWPFQRQDPVNDLNSGRFARYPNGKVEIKSAEAK